MASNLSLAELCEQDFPSNNVRLWCLSRESIAKLCGAKALSRVRTVRPVPGFTTRSGDDLLELTAGCEVGVTF